MERERGKNERTRERNMERWRERERNTLLITEPSAPSWIPASSTGSWVRGMGEGGVRERERERWREGEREGERGCVSGRSRERERRIGRGGVKRGRISAEKREKRGERR